MIYSYPNMHNSCRAFKYRSRRSIAFPGVSGGLHNHKRINCTPMAASPRLSGCDDTGECPRLKRYKFISCIISASSPTSTVIENVCQQIKKTNSQPGTNDFQALILWCFSRSGTSSMIHGYFAVITTCEDKKEKKQLALYGRFRSGCIQSRQRPTVRTKSHVNHFGPEFVAPSGAHCSCSVFAERTRALLRIRTANRREGLVTSRKETDMVNMTDQGREKCAQCADTGTGTLKGVFFPHSVLRSPDVLAETPQRQMAWIRLVSYLHDSCLPLSGCVFPDSDRFWMTVCGLSAAEMREPNRLWVFDDEKRLHLYLDAEEAGL